MSKNKTTSDVPEKVALVSEQGHFVLCLEEECGVKKQHVAEFARVHADAPVGEAGNGVRLLRSLFSELTEAMMQGYRPNLVDMYEAQAEIEALEARAVTPSTDAELLDAIEGLLITFVYENPLSPDLEKTTRDAHIGVAEELLIHHGREAFVKSRVDRSTDAVWDEAIAALVSAKERIKLTGKQGRSARNAEMQRRQSIYVRGWDDAIGALETARDSSKQ